ncbi:MAG: tRNA (guanine-N1)-methyltransferase [Flavobacteriales bacterium]
MKIHTFFCTFILSFCLLSSASFAQSGRAYDSLDVSAKVDYLFTESSSYKHFKVVEKVWLKEVIKQIKDSLSSQEKEHQLALQQIDKQSKTIESLNQTLKSNNSKLSIAENQKDQMSFLGKPFSKSAYQAIMWAIVAVLALLLLIFIGKFKSSSSLTSQSQKEKLTLESELEDVKKKALEREQKLKRELQDEINKNTKLSNQ